MRFNGNPLLVVLVILASMPSIYGLGMAFASLVITAKEAQNFVFLVRGLVMIFCGITFPVTHPARLDAGRCRLAAANLYDPRRPRRGAGQRLLAGPAARPDCAGSVLARSGWPPAT